MSDAHLLRQVELYLREEADFNRSWIDGRRGDPNPPEEYKARRLQLAEERDAWADAVARAQAKEGKHP